VFNGSAAAGFYWLVAHSITLRCVPNRAAVLIFWYYRNIGSICFEAIDRKKADVGASAFAYLKGYLVAAGSHLPLHPTPRNLQALLVVCDALPRIGGSADTSLRPLSPETCT
jgi:hypothetical protein